MRVVEHRLAVRGTDIPVVAAHPSASAKRNGQRLLFIYGGSKKEDQRKKIIRFWGPTLTTLGFIVYAFEFRSNLNRRNFRQYGLYDRLEDTREVFRWLRTNSGSQTICPDFDLPLSIMGVSMGGYLAVLLASENAFLIRSLILVAPAAYHDQACARDVTFGPAFRRAIREPEHGWRGCAAFERAQYITAEALIIAYGKDEIVPREITDTYARNMHAKRNAIHRQWCYPPYRLRYEVLEEFQHRGTFDNPKKREQITRLLCEFL